MSFLGQVWLAALFIPFVVHAKLFIQAIPCMGDEVVGVLLIEPPSFKRLYRCMYLCLRSRTGMLGMIVHLILRSIIKCHTYESLLVVCMQLCTYSAGGML